jgi:multisubunit Na+/H+ antiporter MnhB subunit
MSGTLYLALSILGVIVVIIIFTYLTRKKPVDSRNKTIAIIIGTIQAAHLLLYLTGLFDTIGKTNIKLSFAISVIFSLICLILSVWNLIPPKKFKHAIKYLFVFLAILQVQATIIIFLLPEAGIPPLIQF